MVRQARDLDQGRTSLVTPHRWCLQGSDYAYSGEKARLLLGNRMGWASLETWFEDDRGRLLAVITNGGRAMVMLLDREGDPGEHLVDPRGEGRSGGFVLSSGQIDTYANRDTVAFEVAGRAVAHLIDHDVWPDDVTVEDDRGR